MQWVTLSGALRALAVGILLPCAIALAEEGPILPGLDALPPAPAASSPQRQKPLAAPRVRRSATAKDQASPDAGLRRGDASDDTRGTHPLKPPIRPNALETAGDQQSTRGLQRKAAEEPIRQHRADVPRDRQEVQRGATSKSQMQPDAGRDQSEIRKTQRGAVERSRAGNEPRGGGASDIESRSGRPEPGRDRREPPRDRPEVQREKARKSLPAARPAGPARNSQPSTPGNAASKTPPTGGLRFPPERR